MSFQKLIWCLSVENSGNHKLQNGTWLFAKTNHDVLLLRIKIPLVPKWRPLGKTKRVPIICWNSKFWRFEHVKRSWRWTFFSGVVFYPFLAMKGSCNAFSSTWIPQLPDEASDSRSISPHPQSLYHYFLRLPLATPHHQLLWPRETTIYFAYSSISFSCRRLFYL